jgi:ribonuclease M5
MKLKIDMPVIVEGKYDKIKLGSLLDALIITTDGFGIFKDKSKTEYIKAVCKDGVIIATDSDSAGNLIRGHLKGVLPPELIYNVYIPQVKGKEKRKTEQSKEGYLGVEGTDKETLIGLFTPFASQTAPETDIITRTDLYNYGLFGKENSAEKRKKLCRALSLPDNISAKALCEAASRLYGRKKTEDIIKSIDGER